MIRLNGNEDILNNYSNNSTNFNIIRDKHRVKNILGNYCLIYLASQRFSIVTGKSRYSNEYAMNNFVYDNLCVFGKGRFSKMRLKDIDKRTAILRAATMAFAQEGFHSAQITQIAKMAGVADGTIYTYFENKEKILITLHEEEMARRDAVLKSRISGCRNTEERLYCIIDCFFNDMIRDRHLTCVMVYEVRTPTRKIREKLLKAKVEYFGIIQGVLQLGIESGEISLPLDINLGRNLIIGTLIFVANEWLFSDNHSGIERTREDTFQLLKNAFQL